MRVPGAAAQCQPENGSRNEFELFNTTLSGHIPSGETKSLANLVDYVDSELYSSIVERVYA